MNFFAGHGSIEQGVTATNWSDDIPADRLIGSYSCGLPGPLLLAVADMQADDVNAAQPVRSVLNLLHQQALRINGSFVGLYGDSRQPAELQQLMPLIQRMQRQHADICFVDLHTTTAPGIPYLSVNAHVGSQQLASQFPLHKVTGLHDSLPGGLAERCNALGLRGFTFEAGHHHSAAAFSNQVALLWLMLVFAGNATRREVKDFTRYERMLALDSPAEQQHFCVASHYRSGADEEFVLLPGLRNFDPVSKDTTVAMNRHGAVLAPADGFLLLPYHHSGDLFPEPGFLLLEAVGASANDESTELAANDGAVSLIG